MITDPYKVLGVSSNASDDEIKKAYRNLSRKYHPDSYSDNPLSDLAEEKFKEVQDAYKQIMDERERGGSGYNRSSGGYGGGYQSSNSSDAESPEMSAVRNFLQSRRYAEAMNALSGISDRNAQWFYYSAIANAGVGNNIQAVNDAQQAYALEPSNPEYRNLVNQLQFRGNRYQSGGGNYGRSPLGTGNLCCDLWCADSLCECMGGDLCACM